MDLTSLAVSETAKLVIKHPTTGADTDIVIELCGKDSKKFREEYAKLIRILQTSKDNKNVDFEKLDVDTYAACTVSWKNMEMDGKQLKCTPKNIKAVYSDRRFGWLHEQVMQWVNDRANFMQPS